MKQLEPNNASPPNWHLVCGLSEFLWPFDTHFVNYLIQIFSTFAVYM